MKILISAICRFISVLPSRVDQYVGTSSTELWKSMPLLNNVYNIGSECIANRIKLFLPNSINGDQTGFISGRNITENTRLIKHSKSNSTYRL